MWPLRIRKDGTYQAEHRGNVFADRLIDVGYGNGDVFQSFNLGIPDWNNFPIIGHTIRWMNVFPNRDFSVKYTHNALKAEVIV